MTILTLTPDRSRIFGLDLLRSIAILLVVTGHSVHLLPASIKTFYFSIPLPDGVSVFFVLSGFLIGRILIRLISAKGASPAVLFDFWTRRWLRTLPAYLLVLFTVIVLSVIFLPRFDIRVAYPYFIFSQNLYTRHPAFFIEAWSLSVEEWFYLLIPGITFILIMTLNIRLRKSLLTTIFVIIIGSVCIRYYRYLTVPVTSAGDWDALFRTQVITRLDSLAFGVLAAYFSIFHQQKWNKYKNSFMIAGLSGVVLVALIPAIWFPDSAFYFCNISVIASSITIMLLLPYLSELNCAGGKLYTFVTYTSLVSYSMYLTHASVIMVFIVSKIPLLQSSQWLAVVARYLLFWMLSYTLAILLYKFWELPFLSWRDARRKIAVS